MPRTKGESTKLVSAKTKSDSLRATVPSFIVKSLDLEAGDQLEWKLLSLEEGTIAVSVKKAETHKEK